MLAQLLFWRYAGEARGKATAGARDKARSLGRPDTSAGEPTSDASKGMQVAYDESVNVTRAGSGLLALLYRNVISRLLSGLGLPRQSIIVG